MLFFRFPSTASTAPIRGVWAALVVGFGEAYNLVSAAIKQRSSSKYMARVPRASTTPLLLMLRLLYAVLRTNTHKHTLHTKKVNFIWFRNIKINRAPCEEWGSERKRARKKTAPNPDSGDLTVNLHLNRDAYKSNVYMCVSVYICVHIVCMNLAGFILGSEFKYLCISDIHILHCRIGLFNMLWCYQA